MCVGTFMSGQFDSPTNSDIGLQQAGGISAMHLRLGLSEIPQYKLQQHRLSATGIGTSDSPGDVLVQ